MSDEVKRWNWYPACMLHSVDGLYVRIGEYERLRAELAEANKRIEDLTRDLHIAEEELYYPDKYGCVVITFEQIDKAWLAARGSESSLSILRLCGIVACSECGGSGKAHKPPMSMNHDCLVCHRNGKSHGWVWKEVSYE